MEMVAANAKINEIATRLKLWKPKRHELEAVVNEVVAANANVMQDYKDGHRGAVNVLVGKVLSQLRGADGKEVRELIIGRIEV